jgi:hypothetical protein
MIIVQNQCIRILTCGFITCIEASRKFRANSSLQLKPRVVPLCLVIPMSEVTFEKVTTCRYAQCEEEESDSTSTCHWPNMEDNMQAKNGRNLHCFPAN